MYTWEFLEWLERRGHKLFRDGGSHRLAIADNSGATPDTTHDGVLWLDPDRPIRAEAAPQMTIYVPLLTLDDEPRIMVVGISAAKILIDKYRFALQAGLPEGTTIDFILGEYNWRD